MPRRKRVRAAKTDPMVPIVGERVAAALRWRDLSTNGAVRQMNASKSVITQQALNYIVRGQTRRCHSSVRAALVRLLRPPVTAAYLSGESSIALPPLLWPPSGPNPDVVMPFDLAGSRHVDRTACAGEMPPDYELNALSLGADLTDAARSEGRPIRMPAPRVDNMARWVLSLPFWREFLFDDQRHGASSDEMQVEAAQFAEHLAKAIEVLLRPWIKGKVTLRRHLLHDIAVRLDRVANTNEDMHEERTHGRLADLAIRDYAHGYGHPHTVQLTEHLRGFRDAERARGTPEAEIARRIAEGDRDDGT